VSFCFVYSTATREDSVKNKTGFSFLTVFYPVLNWNWNE